MVEFLKSNEEINHGTEAAKPLPPQPRTEPLGKNINPNPPTGTALRHPRFPPRGIARDHANVKSSTDAHKRPPRCDRHHRPQKERLTPPIPLGPVSRTFAYCECRTILLYDRR